MFLNNEQGIKLSGFFKGVVVKHCFISKEENGKKITKSGNGKCKIWIPGVYADELRDNPDALPDAEQISPLFGGSWNGNGVFSYPNLGSTVICGFYNEDQNFPFFFGSILGGPAANIEYGKAKPNLSDTTIKKGSDAFKHIISVDKSRIEFNEGGMIHIKTQADRQDENHTNIYMDGKGNLTIDTTQQVFVKTPQINLSADQQFEITSPQVKINALQSYELNAQTVKENISSKRDTEAQNVTIMTTDSTNIKSPTILMDASEGSCKLQGKAHSPIFVD